MRLQTDPTVIYGMGAGYTGKLTRKDLETPTAYNTYTNQRFAAGPYRGAGRGLAEGGAHPAKTPYIFISSPTGKGAIRLPQNLVSHNRAVQD
ncbi:protein YceG like protein [Klebsiella pneumoniae]|uniref:Protein YceG like protein n=1 Tax=Klebsiella pneumoniae TaxID=573 RepID=A0A447S5L4_KLEPN|nr:protein YceG like protein [Klebsiella pneumoniae]